MAPATSFLTLLLLVTVAGCLLQLAQSTLCTQQELRVFEQVSSQFKICTQVSGLSFEMPPRQSLPKTAQPKLCKAPGCTNLLGLVDDLDVPKCDVTFDNRNVTLQQGLDKFAALCDSVSPTPLPTKKKSSSSSSSGLYGRKRNETKSAAERAVGNTSSWSVKAVVVAAATLVLVTSLLG